MGREPLFLRLAQAGAGTWDKTEKNNLNRRQRLLPKQWKKVWIISSGIDIYFSGPLNVYVSGPGSMLNYADAPRTANPGS